MVKVKKSREVIKLRNIKKYIISEISIKYNITFLIYTKHSPIVGDKVIIGNSVYNVYKVLDRINSFEYRLSYSKVFLRKCGKVR